MHYQNKWIIIAFFGLWLTELSGQWCCVDSTVLIKDKSTAALKLLISSALNNDLANPGQGVCGVRIQFEHEFIGDLTMDLISPSGQRLRLVGPIGNSGISDFSHWAVTFIPCADKSNPDKGFKMKWDNQQAWGIFGKFYNGTYYPEGGCLENFNLGSVNGIWTLEVHDDERFYEGKIESFCLLFCDPSGINCMDCSPNGGVFINDHLDYCVNDPQLLIQERITFPVYKPDSTLYSFTYLVTENDTLIYIGDSLDLRSFKVGDYVICGISFLTSDSLKLPKLGTTISAFKNDLVINLNSFCAEISKNCLEVSIHPNYTQVQDSFFLCRGDTLHLGTLKYYDEGRYTIPLRSTFGCDSTLDLQLRVVDMKIALTKNDTITCSNPVIQLDISRSIKTSRTRINWSTTDGNFVDLRDSLSVSVNQEGTYKVVFEDGFCKDSLEISVLKRDKIPSLIVSSDTINCFHNRATLKAATDAINPIFNWSDGINRIGVDSVIQVNQQGFYYVTVTDDAGCSNIGSIEVLLDTFPAELVLFADDLSCRDSISILRFNSNKSLLNFMWTGPNFFQSTNLDPSINIPGFYTLTVTADNGCSNSGFIRVSSSIQKPDYNVKPDTLNCLNNFNVQINANSNSILDSISYSNGYGFKSNLLDPIVQDSGFYIVYLRDSAACVLDTVIYIHLDSLRPQFKLQAGILDCFKDSIQIALIDTSGLPGLVYHWTGPIGFNEIKSSPFIKEAGIYKIQVTGINGCTSFDSIEIKQDTLKPVIQFSGEQLTCYKQVVQINATVSISSNYQWSGPGMFSSMLEDPVVSDSGFYKLIATSVNGCKAEKSIYIDMDRSPPIQSIQGNDLSCIYNQAKILIKLNQGVDTLHWSGPQFINSIADSILVSTPGVYSVFVRGINGCTDSASIRILLDTLPPSLQLQADTITCARTNARVISSSPDSIVNYKWLNPLQDSFLTKDITSNLPGWYLLKVTAKNGCMASDSILLIEKRNLPLFQVANDSLSCKDSTALLQIISNETNLRYHWEGPGLLTSDSAIILTNLEGFYKYTVTNSFGCSLTDSIRLQAFKQAPKISYSDSIINCATKSNPELWAFFTDSLMFYEWTTPSGSVLLRNPIPVNEAGYYIFRGINEFGCIGIDSINMRFDTLPPIIQNIQVDTLSCSTNQFFPLVEVLPANVRYQWNGPSNFNSNLPNPAIRLPGVYLLSLTAPNNCMVDTTITVLKDSLLPIINAFGSVLNCSSDSTQIRVQSNDSLINVFWQSPTGVFINERNPFVKDSGWYQLIVEGKNNCLLLDSVYVGLDKSLPVFVLQDTLLNCLTDSVQLNLQTNDLGLSYTWSRHGSFLSNSKNPFVKDTGFFNVRVKGLNHCEHLDSLYVRDQRQKPNLSAFTDTLNCIQASVQLNPNFDTISNRFLWTGPFGLDSTQVNPKISISGFYTLAITNQYGCVHDTTLYVPIDTSTPSIQIATLDSLICEQDLAKLYILAGCNQCDYTWSTMDGSIQSGTKGDTILIKGSGTYMVNIVNKQTGCIGNESRILRKDTVGITGIRLNVEDISCFGLDNGAIEILEVISKFPPVTFSTDGIQYNPISKLQNLTAGVQHLFFKDRFGCLLDTLVQINEPPQAFLELGPDTSIVLGSSYFIDTQTNLDTNFIQFLVWDPSTDLACIDCIKVNASPKTDTRYTLKLIDQNGCEIIDAITIRVLINSDLFIPNAFTPNGDNINDLFSIFSPKGSLHINALRIFDRWGNLVHTLENINFSGEFQAWDGRIGDQPALPGVYVYLIELQNPKGVGLIFKGDLTLVR
ncbi:MAG: gliding motility-associated C-terminal domain-containing protein [Saprospiraceae bacterium]|jgi:gliding motility-associated-like protein